MKKKIKKLALGRETIHSLDHFRSVAGGASATACTHPRSVLVCTDDGNTYGDCGPTHACSNDCATGGTACTGFTCDC
jgi:hypothetical protein